LQLLLVMVSTNGESNKCYIRQFLDCNAEQQTNVRMSGPDINLRSLTGLGASASLLHRKVGVDAARGESGVGATHLPCSACTSGPPHF
jgi:hypothetical protein